MKNNYILTSDHCSRIRQLKRTDVIVNVYVIVYVSKNTKCICSLLETFVYLFLNAKFLEYISHNSFL